MRKDIYIVSVQNVSTDAIKISSEGYETLIDAIGWVESRNDAPRKDRYMLRWVSDECIYNIHIIKVQ